MSIMVLRKFILDSSTLVLVAGFVFVGSIYSSSYIDVVTHPQSLLFILLFALFLLRCAYVLKTSRKVKAIDITLPQLLISLYVVLAFLQSDWQFITFHQLVLLLSPLVFLLGSSMRILMNNVKYRRLIYYTLCWILAINVVQGFLQYFNFMPCFNANFSFSGCFLNPGSYAVSLVVLLPFSLQLFIDVKWGWIRGVLALLIFSALFLIAKSESRTSWIAFSLFILYFSENRFNLVKRFTSIKSQATKFFLITIALLLVVLLGTILYNFKPDSAFGRSIIWQRSLVLLGENLLGAGCHQFSYLYNEYKSDIYIEADNVAKYAHIEGNVCYAFNDYLQIGIEYGWLAVVILLALVVFAFRGNMEVLKESVLPFKSALLVLLFSSLSSYPLQILPLSVCFFLFLGVTVRSNKKWIIKREKRYSLLLIFFLIVTSITLLFYAQRQKSYYAEWKTAYANLHAGNVLTGLIQYHSLENHLKTDEYFMYNYACELQRLHKRAEGVRVLELVKQRLNDEDVYMRLGEGYESLERYDEAIASFEKASRLAPQLFYPRYRLLSLYYAIGERKKSIELAKDLLNTPIKIPSSEVDIMLSDIKQYLQWLEEKEN